MIWMIFKSTVIFLASKPPKKVQSFEKSFSDRAAATFMASQGSFRPNTRVYTRVKTSRRMSLLSQWTQEATSSFLLFKWEHFQWRHSYQKNAGMCVLACCMWKRWKSFLDAKTRRKCQSPIICAGEMDKVQQEKWTLICGDVLMFIAARHINWPIREEQREESYRQLTLYSNKDI